MHCTDMDQTVQERTCCYDNGLPAVKDTDMILYTNNTSTIDNDAVDKRLSEMEVFLLLYNSFHGKPVELLVTLET